MAKLMGRLDRGNSFPKVDAMCGWAHHDDQNVTISSKNWTDEVFMICKSIGHILAPNPERNQGGPGKWHACHAEKRLVAFFVAHHVFLKDEVLEEDEIEEEKSGYMEENFPRLLREEITEEQYNRWWEQMELKEEKILNQLYTARPPISLQESKDTSQQGNLQ